MKTIKIPDYRSPYEVIVNGVKHIYSAGANVEVTDEIADIIEASEAARQTKAPAADSGFDWDSITDKPFTKVDGFVTETLDPAYLPEHSHKWNDIEDKPFTTVGGDTLTWDGNTEGLVSAAGFFYKVIDTTATFDELSGGGYVCTTEGDISVEFVEISPNVYGPMTGEVYFCTVAGANLGPDVVFPEAGIYFLNNGSGFYTQSLTIPGYDGFPKRDQLNESALPYLTDANGVQYKLTVSTDGVLSAAAV